MAYDEALADTIRRHLAVMGAAADERKMFGGLAFMINGNMALAVMGQDGAIVRIDPESAEALVASSHATLAEMRGRPMNGWVQIYAEHVERDAEMARWVALGVERARSLPAK
jgi:TfoX/Sxy family transcriptional regulator of competence genes